MTDTTFVRQFITALNAGSVVTKMEEIIKNAIKNKLNNVTTKLDNLTVTITMLRNELKLMDGLISDLKDDKKKLSAEIYELKNRLDDMETVNRRDNLTFTEYVFHTRMLWHLKSQQKKVTDKQRPHPQCFLIKLFIFVTTYSRYQSKQKIFLQPTCYQKDHHLHHLLLALNL